MAFWQTNTGFQVWLKTNPFSTWFSSGLSSPFSWATTTQTKTTTKKKNDYTYNSRYPWFDEEDYKRLKQIVDAQGVTGSKYDQLMDEAYQYYYPQVLNKHKLAERGEELNNIVYENGDAILNGEWNASEKIKLTQLSQKAKEKFWIPYDYPDEDLIKTMIEWTEDWNKLLYNYLYNGDDELLYKAGIYDVQQWGTKNLINQASQTDKARGDQNLWEKWETVTNYTNLIWLWTEKLDEQAGKFADNWLAWWTKAAESTTNSLKDKIENMSQEEIEAYRKQYQQLLKDKDRRTARVQGNTLVSQLWNAIKWNLSYDYNDEEFMEWLVSQKTNLRESLAWADDILNEEHNPNVIQFFWNIPSSALKTFTATVRWMSNPYDTLKWIYKLAATEEWHQAILARYGSWDAFADALNTDPVGVADDILAVVELGWNIASWWLKVAWKVTGNSSLTNAGNWISTNNVWSANDALAQQSLWAVYGWMDNLAKRSNNKYVQWANRILQDESSLAKMTEEGKKWLDYLWETAPVQAIRNRKDEMINNLVWIDEKDREFIQNNKEIVNEYLDWKKNVETVFEEVKNKIDEKRVANSEMWKEYDTLRNNKKKVVNTQWITSDMKQSLKKNWITIDKDGNLKFNKMNKFNATQQKAILDAWNELKSIEKSKNINAGNVLDMRQKFDDKLNWDGKAMDLNWNLSAVDKATESLIKDMRWVIDERAKTSVAWLKELDAKYADAIAEMQQIRKDWLNADGTFKDSARSKLRNLTKAWNEEKLARLEQAVPWITSDLKALDVWLTVQKATSLRVWQYVKSIWMAWTVGALASWNIWTALVSIWAWILATPKNFVKLVEAYPDIISKLQAWQELLPSDMSKLQSLATRLEDTGNFQG